jgi:diguanylate cyclase (GGDEF)-like protein
MASRASRLLHVSHDDPDVRRRGRLLITVAAGMIGLTVLFSPVMLLIPYGETYIVATLGGIAVAAVAIEATRRGRVELGVAIFLADYVLAVTGSVAWVGEVTAGPLFCLLMVTLAGSLLRPVHVAGVYVGALALMVVLPLVASGRTRPIEYLELLVCIALLSAFTAFTAAATSVDIRRSLLHAVAANEVLEARVIERTAQLEELTMRDPLTGLHNRRYLAQELPRMHAAASRVGGTLFLAAIDVDNFKSINDAFGHSGGDEVLRRLATCLQDGVRAGDLIARVGGEEFVVVLAASTTAGAQLTCDRIRQGIGELTWTGLSFGLHVTVSMGLADGLGTRTSQELWIAADTLLYEAKRTGKNRVCTDLARVVP